MKVCIVTILDNTNSGTYLQAYALAKAIEKIGGEPFYINYTRPGECFLPQYLKTLKQSRNPLWWFQFLFHWKRSEELKTRLRNLLNGHLTPHRFYSFKSVANANIKADVFLTGSDQVWNSVYNKGIDQTFYLDFAPEEAVRVAYGASIGMEQFPASEREETFRLLNRYKAIGVRESTSMKMLESIGITTDKISFVLDPTLLLCKKEWEKVSSPRIFNFDYLLVYSVEYKRTNMVMNVARKIAAIKKLPIVCVTRTAKALPGCDYGVTYADANQFLSCFIHASFTVVSSFHGTAFSINLEKDFVTVQPSRFNSRVDSLLRLCNLEGRKCSTMTEDINEYLKPIDYSLISKTIETERMKSVDFLRRNIKEL